jgi:hypothetical protein
MPPGNGAIPTSAFLSYAHDTPQHSDAVRRLWYLLIENGVNAWADLAAEDQRQEWPRRMEEKLDASDFVLVVASPEYRRRTNRPPEAPDGRGVEYEAALLRDRLIGNRTLWYGRILPIVLPGRHRTEIPDFLGPWSGTFYEVKSFTVTGAESLMRILTGQPGEGGPIPGPPPRLPQRPPPTDSRSHILNELIDGLSAMPALESTPARATFLELVQARLDRPVNVKIELDSREFLRDLIAGLAPRPGGLSTLLDVVRAFHHGQPIEGVVRHLVERWEAQG